MVKLINAITLIALSIIVYCNIGDAENNTPITELNSIGKTIYCPSPKAIKWNDDSVGKGFYSYNFSQTPFVLQSDKIYKFDRADNLPTEFVNANIIVANTSNEIVCTYKTQNNNLIELETKTDKVRFMPQAASWQLTQSNSYNIISTKSCRDKFSSCTIKIAQ